MLGSIWQKWLAMGVAIGRFNSRVILTLVYVLIVTPLGLCARIFQDPLALRGKRASSWTTRVPENGSIENAKRQG
jgi:hypothetical protein